MDEIAVVYERPHKQTIGVAIEDSIYSKAIDTTTLKGKRDYIRRGFEMQNCPSFISDTLLDLNYDGYLDYVVKNYSCSGTGIKNGWEVLIFNPKLQCYFTDSQLLELPNPTFYKSAKKITSFYLGGGGGYGSRLQWLNRKWTVTKRFDVYHQMENTEWKISYPLKGRKQAIKREYQMIPYSDILETEIEE